MDYIGIELAAWSGYEGGLCILGRQSQRMFPVDGGNYRWCYKQQLVSRYLVHFRNSRLVCGEEEKLKRVERQAAKVNGGNGVSSE